MAIIYEADGRRFVVNDDCPSEYRLEALLLIERLKVALESEFVSEMSELVHVFSNHRHIIDAQYVLDAAIRLTELAIDDPEIYDFTSNDKPALISLQDDLNGLRWRWFDEMIGSIEKGG